MGAARPRRILIVEDNPDGRETFCVLLRCWGHEVQAATDGLDGLRQAFAWRPDVAVVDIGLPGLDGWGVARALRCDPRTCCARLIALTGYSTDPDYERSREAGFDFHIVKPCDPGLLERLLTG
jgi:two-component system, sensor histidine kinase